MASILDFTRFPLAVNFAVFALAAGIVWLAGTRIARYADRISRQTGLGGVVVGLLLLGGVTSLPEAAVSITSAYAGNAALAVNSLLGGVAMQVAILAVADAAIGREALTSVLASPAVLLQAALNVLMLALVAAGTVIVGVQVLGVGLWSWAIVVVYAISITMIVRNQGHAAWMPVKRGARAADSEKRSHEPAKPSQQPGEKLGATIAKTVFAGALILIAGFVLSRTGEAIAEQTGLGSSFVGAVLVAISTSLPEVSTVLGAVKLRRYEMAVADIFGTNLFDIVLVFVADLVYTGGPVLGEVGRFSTVAALLGIAVTTLFLVGLIERRDRTVMRMGVDSLAVLIVYFGGVFMLYRIA
jgi:cation:H+ antiporter